MCYSWYFFFFKQKTAYEMRISDWSSDVCSSDLPRRRADDLGDAPALVERRRARLARCGGAGCLRGVRCGQGVELRRAAAAGRGDGGVHRVRRRDHPRYARGRSEEHTSELQSLMRISYAVFCLKKKKKYNVHISRNHTTTRTTRLLL